MPGDGQGQYGAHFWWEFVEGEGVGGAELLLPLGVAEDIPSLYGYPEDGD
ncbi:MAG: hypothetical protein ABI286_06510 [Edaphobacter sp.]